MVEICKAALKYNHLPSNPTFVPLTMPAHGYSNVFLAVQCLFQQFCFCNQPTSCIYLMATFDTPATVCVESRWLNASPVTHMGKTLSCCLFISAMPLKSPCQASVLITLGMACLFTLSNPISSDAGSLSSHRTSFFRSWPQREWER